MKQIFEGKEVFENDVIYTVTSAPQHGKWGGYVHAVGYKVKKTADGKALKLVLAWTGDDFTSSKKAWDQAEARSKSPLKEGINRRILAEHGGMPRLLKVNEE